MRRVHINYTSYRHIHLSASISGLVPTMALALLALSSTSEPVTTALMIMATLSAMALILRPLINGLLPGQRPASTVELDPGNAFSLNWITLGTLVATCLALSLLVGLEALYAPRQLLSPLIQTLTATAIMTVLSISITAYMHSCLRTRFTPASAG